jgi:hypothetical protein
LFIYFEGVCVHCLHVSGRSSVVASFVLLLALSSIGCGGPSEVPQAESEVHLKALAVLYGRFISQNMGRTPANEQQLKTFAQGVPRAELEAMKVSNVDALFVSPRDNQPYVVKYNVPAGVPGPAGAPIIAHEQTGVDGKRYVATFLGGVDLLDEAAFQKATAGSPPSK